MEDEKLKFEINVLAEFFSRLFVSALRFKSAFNKI
jgi:hypothetical protein